MQVESDDDVFLPQERQKIIHEEVTNGAVAVDGDIESEDTLSGWYEGVVSIWKRTHGFIKYVDSTGEDASTFFHSSAVYTNDKRAYLRKGMAVRFRIQSPVDEKSFAAMVEGVSGSALDFHAKHGEHDSYDRTIQCNGHWFTGSITFYSRKRMYGRIMTEAAEFKARGISDADIEVIGDCYFKEVDIDCVDYPIKIDRDTDVRYQLFNSSRGWGAMNVQLANGNPFPQFTEEDRAAKRAVREERQEAEDANTDDDREQQEERSPKRKRRERKKKRGRKTKKEGREANEAKEEVREEQDFMEINEQARYRGTIDSFSLHRFGFIIPRETDNIPQFGILKRARLCFRVQEMNTQARPPMVDVDATVTYSLIRQNNGILYAVNVSDEHDRDIVAERQFERAEPRDLVDGSWREGEVHFYNWRRGHGRVVFDGDEEQKFFFHRDDILSDDKVPGVYDGDIILCQECDDPKGPAVTNIQNTDRSNISGFVPKPRPRRRSRR